MPCSTSISSSRACACPEPRHDLKGDEPMTGWRADELEKIETCGRAGNRVAPIRRDVGKPKDDLGSQGRRRLLRQVGERPHVRLVPRHPATPRGPDQSGRRREGRHVPRGRRRSRSRIDDASREKYGRYAEGVVASTLTPLARSAALKLAAAIASDPGTAIDRPIASSASPSRGDCRHCAVGSC